MLSHRGRVRHANEDACDARPERRVFVVCDGMGGAAAGEVASHLALQTFLDSLDWQPSLAQPSAQANAQPSVRTRPIPPQSASQSGPVAARPPQDGELGQNGAAPHPPTHPRARLEEAVRAANHAVFRHSLRSRSLRGMGTTLVALLLDDAPLPVEDAALFPDDAALGWRDADPDAPNSIPGPTLWLVHVGDSRCYRLRSGALHLLTQDHSLVEEQIQAGLISRLQASSSPIRNIITRVIGPQPAVEPEIAAHPAQAGDLYLLASDGLTRDLDDAEIAAILSRAAPRAASASLGSFEASESALLATLQAALDTACQALIDAANAKGGGDNITVLLVPCP